MARVVAELMFHKQMALGRAIRWLTAHHSRHECGTLQRPALDHLEGRRIHRSMPVAISRDRAQANSAAILARTAAWTPTTCLLSATDLSFARHCGLLRSPNTRDARRICSADTVRQYTIYATVVATVLCAQLQSVTGQGTKQLEMVRRRAVAWCKSAPPIIGSANRNVRLIAALQRDGLL